MAQNQLEQLFYEDIYDALRAAVQAAGGAKVVGAKLWPNKPVAAAHRDLLDALNRDRDKKLDPEETFHVFRLSREIGFHAAFHFACDQCGYHKPTPVSMQEQAESILERAADLARESRAVALQLERIHQSGVLKGVPKTATS